eukprot:5090521-Pyramimonas_sp.AAC.1
MSLKPSANFPPQASSRVARAIGHARDQCSTIQCSFESVGRWLEQHEAVKFLPLEARVCNVGALERVLGAGS